MSWINYLFNPNTNSTPLTISKPAQGTVSIAPTDPNQGTVSVASPHLPPSVSVGLPVNKGFDPLNPGQSIQGGGYNASISSAPTGAATTSGSSSTFGDVVQPGGGAGGSSSSSPYMTYYQNGQNQNLNQQQIDQNAANLALQNSVDAFNKQNGITDAANQYDLNYAQDLAGTQKGRIGEDLSKGVNASQQDYDYTNAQRDIAEQRNQEDLNRSNLIARGNLGAGYAARGIGDSSARETAQAQLATEYGVQSGRSAQDYNNAKVYAKQVFDRNISGLNTNAQRQLSDIDNYLGNLQTKYNFQTQNIDLARYQQDTAYKAQADKLLASQAQIDQSRQALHDYVNNVLVPNLTQTPAKYQTTAQTLGIDPQSYVSALQQSQAANPYMNPGTVAKPATSNLSGAYIAPTTTKNPYDLTSKLTGAPA